VRRRRPEVTGGKVIEYSERGAETKLEAGRAGLGGTKGGKKERTEGRPRLGPCSTGKQPLM